MDTNKHRSTRKKYHFIYVTTCLVTGRYYIGMHSTDDLNDGYIGSGKRLWQSLKKHGREQHRLEILEFLPTRAMLRLREAEHVNEERVKQDPFCMNLALGGEGGWERSNSKLTAVQRVKISSAGAKIRNTIFAKGTDAAKIRGKRSAVGWKRNYAAGLISKPPGFTGMKHDTTSLAKMSVRGKMRVGVRNPQFGRCWITYEGENKSIKRSELDEYLSQGWIRGRVMDRREAEP